MPTISVNDKAPEGFKTLSIGNAELDFSSGDVESTDATVVANANSHPWLDVTTPKAEIYHPETVEAHIAPEDDVLSRVNDVSFDLDEVRKVEEAKRSEAAPAVEPDAVQETTTAFEFDTGENE